MKLLNIYSEFSIAASKGSRNAVAGLNKINNLLKIIKIWQEVSLMPKRDFNRSCLYLLVVLLCGLNQMAEAFQTTPTTLKNCMFLGPNGPVYGSDPIAMCVASKSFHPDIDLILASSTENYCAYRANVPVAHAHSFSCTTSYSCPAGLSYDSDSKNCKSPTNGGRRELGNPCPRHSCESHVGDPINSLNGNYYRNQEDYRSSGVHPLVFQRTYNSSSLVSASNMGPRWRHSYDRSIGEAQKRPTNSVNYNFVEITREDGKGIFFSSTDGINWSADGDIYFTLLRVVDGSGNTAGWTLRNDRGETESYDAYGRWIQLSGLSNYSIYLSYTSGRLNRVVDSNGRALGFFTTLKEI